MKANIVYSSSLRSYSHRDYYIRILVRPRSETCPFHLRKFVDGTDWFLNQHLRCTHRCQILRNILLCNWELCGIPWCHILVGSLYWGFNEQTAQGKLLGWEITLPDSTNVRRVLRCILVSAISEEVRTTINGRSNRGSWLHRYSHCFKYLSYSGCPSLYHWTWVLYVIPLRVGLF